jgi:hypothetical protein
MLTSHVIDIFKQFKPQIGSLRAEKKNIVAVSDYLGALSSYTKLLALSTRDVIEIEGLRLRLLL